MMTQSLTLKQLRKNTGLRRKEFLHKLGVGARALAYWESGERVVPIHRIANYARVCGVSRESLMNAVGETFEMRIDK